MYAQAVAITQRALDRTRAGGIVDHDSAPQTRERGAHALNMSQQSPPKLRWGRGHGDLLGLDQLVQRAAVEPGSGKNQISSGSPRRGDD
jgi:hypothetical protein